MFSPGFLQRISLPVLLIIVTCSPGMAQSLKLGAGGGLVILVPPFSNGGHDRYTMPVHDGGYGFGRAVPTLGTEIKYMPPGVPLTLTAGFAYAHLTGSGTRNWVETTGSEVTSTLEYRADLLVTSLGAQWNLLKGPFRPFVGARLLWSYVPEIQSEATGARMPDPQIGGFSRVGFGFLGGAEFDVASRLSLDVSARFGLTNLFPDRRADSPFPNAVTLGVTLLYEVGG